jgi:hypothetical protein
MRWTTGGISDDIEDRRDDGGGVGFGGYGPHIGIGGFLLLLILSVVFHRNLFTVIQRRTGLPQECRQSFPVAQRIRDGLEILSSNTVTVAELRIQTFDQVRLSQTLALSLS